MRRSDATREGAPAAVNERGEPYAPAGAPEDQVGVKEEGRDASDLAGRRGPSRE